jgi:hypothetical protein
MKSIIKLSLTAAMAVAFISTASAFPYTQPQYGHVVMGTSPTKSTVYRTIAVSAHGQGVSAQGKTATSHTSVKQGN